MRRRDEVEAFIEETDELLEESRETQATARELLPARHVRVLDSLKKG